MAVNNVDAIQVVTHTPTFIGESVLKFFKCHAAPANRSPLTQCQMVTSVTTPEAVLVRPNSLGSGAVMNILRWPAWWRAARLPSRLDAN